MQPTNKPKVSSQNKYTQLLIILITNFILTPFLQSNIGEIALSFIFLCAIIIIVKTFFLKPKLFTIYSTIALLAFLLEIFGRWGLYESGKVTFLLSIQLVYVLYLGVAAYLILRDILLTQQVTIDMIRGGICVYFLMGFVWALLYSIAATFESRAFSQPIFVEESFSKAIYFSFTTLTTLGYGDITPVSPLATMLTNLEAIIGQMYPSILIAILVGSYLSQRNEIG